MPINTVTEYGCDIAGTTANRPIRAPHGFRYYNHSAKLLEVYDQIDEAWYATISNTPNTILLNNTNYATLALAFAAASDGDRIYLTSGTYLVSAELNIRNNLAVVGVGLGSIVQQVGNGIVIFKANAVRNWTIDGILLKGTGAGVDAKLLHITGAANYGWTVKNCNFENSWYWGLYSDATVSILNDHWGEVGVIFNCNFLNNITGAQIQGGSEWFKWIGCTFGSNSTGIQLAAGNHNFVGCNVVENTDGVIMLGGGNHGHGSWVGGSFAHNTTRALDIQGSVAAPFTYGFDFIGCNWGADSVTSNIIKLSYCAGINFIGGYWSTPVRVTDATNPIQGVCQIIGMHVYTNGVATITNQNGARVGGTISLTGRRQGLLRDVHANAVGRMRLRSEHRRDGCRSGGSGVNVSVIH